MRIFLLFQTKKTFGAEEIRQNGLNSENVTPFPSLLTESSWSPNETEVWKWVRKIYLGKLSLYITRKKHRMRLVACSKTPHLHEVASSSSSFEGFTVIARISANGDVKLKIDVSGSKTQVIFDDVFSRLVAAAQPIPGFRRLKGGKTPDIPKDILMHLLGPSKVNKQSIQKIINTTVAEYVEKEGLKVTRDLKVDETFEELEAVFKPGEAFAFNATIRLLETDKKKP
ncbi:unnamed protein product [Spirodela intermedia]|uniref:peptidylprolyl isomerase n=1 Tax=Spirodela intermedia TaxID=51605 RepID=A0A7I8KFU6_SPIIN|nr:unnamed protein product [Spirodela intermedia]